MSRGLLVKRGTLFHLTVLGALRTLSKDIPNSRFKIQHSTFKIQDPPAGPGFQITTFGGFKIRDSTFNIQDYPAAPEFKIQNKATHSSQRED